MQAWALLNWWYTDGWLGEGRRQVKRLSRVEDYFSFGMLLRTLFQPFRQIDTGPRRGGLSIQFRAWIDRTVSRFVGATARLILLLIGGIWWLISALMGVVWMLFWPCIPVAPVIGFVLAAGGVGR